MCACRELERSGESEMRARGAKKVLAECAVVSSGHRRPADKRGGEVETPHAAPQHQREWRRHPLTPSPAAPLHAFLDEQPERLAARRTAWPGPAAAPHPSWHPLVSTMMSAFSARQSAGRLAKQGNAAGTKEGRMRDEEARAGSTFPCGRWRVASARLRRSDRLRGRRTVPSGRPSAPSPVS